MVRRWGVGPDRLSERVGALIDEFVRVIEVDGRTAWRAGEVRAAHYHRTTADLSLADCLLLAGAGPEDEIASSDRAVCAIGRDLGIAVVPLLDSQGKRSKA